ncbi:MAG TPA: hypothetical protein VLL04_05890 [Rhizomicrobium sp.]|nr:hypothetical protein [Rhizomicrobium sp.]
MTELTKIALDEIALAEIPCDAAGYRERALAAQKRAAEAPTTNLAALWLELAERYFDLADQVEQPAALRFPHKLHAGHSGRPLL